MVSLTAYVTDFYLQWKLNKFSFIFVTEGGAEKMERARSKKPAKSLCDHV
jgi:hypothetical protein